MAEKGGNKVLSIITICVMLVTIGLSGCIENQEDNKTHRTIIVDFKPGTNITYLTYLEEKYNLTAGAMSKYPDGNISWVHFSISKEKVDSIMKQIKKEDLVDDVVFADVIG